MPETVAGPRAHILRIGPGRAFAPDFTYAVARADFRGQTEAGRTEHLIVYTDGTPNGDASAQAVLRTAEADYQAVTNWFGGISLPPGQEGDDQTTPRTATPVQVLIDQQAGGAYHFGCDATDIYIEPTPELANGFMVAELVEIFEAAINNGWQCGNTNGEGLSRVLAGERNANLGPLFTQTGQTWWQAGHADYVNSNAADDRDENSNGCATLFLFYLNKQLGFDWRTITTTGGATLGETYQKLTGKSGTQGFSEFVSLLERPCPGWNAESSGQRQPIPHRRARTATTACAAAHAAAATSGSQRSRPGDHALIRRYAARRPDRRDCARHRAHRPGQRLRLRLVWVIRPTPIDTDEYASLAPLASQSSGAFAVVGAKNKSPSKGCDSDPGASRAVVSVKMFHLGRWLSTR